MSSEADRFLEALTALDPAAAKQIFEDEPDLAAESFLAACGGGDARRVAAVAAVLARRRFS